MNISNWSKKAKKVVICSLVAFSALATLPAYAGSFDELRSKFFNGSTSIFGDLRYGRNWNCAAYGPTAVTAMQILMTFTLENNDLYLSTNWGEKIRISFLEKVISGTLNNHVVSIRFGSKKQLVIESMIWPDSNSYGEYPDAVTDPNMVATLYSECEKD